jgi:BMFP domain-containing protein YqiC
MQTDNPLLDGLAKFFTDAAGAANSVRTEIDGFVRQRLEKLIADMDFVPREEFEAVKAMAAKAREENERLAARVAELERNASGTTAPPSPHIGPV